MLRKGVYPCDLVPSWPPERSNFSSCGASMGLPYCKKQQRKFEEWCPDCTLPPRGHIVIFLRTIWARIDKHQTVSEPQTPWIFVGIRRGKKHTPFVYFELLLVALSSGKIGAHKYTWMQFPWALLDLVLYFPILGWSRVIQFVGSFL